MGRPGGTPAGAFIMDTNPSSTLFYAPPLVVEKLFEFARFLNLPAWDVFVHQAINGDPLGVSFRISRNPL